MAPFTSDVGGHNEKYQWIEEEISKEFSIKEEKDKMISLVNETQCHINKVKRPRIAIMTYILTFPFGVNN